MRRRAGVVSDRIDLQNADIANLFHLAGNSAQVLLF
jgi:hypothetical protein